MRRYAVLVVLVSFGLSVVAGELVLARFFPTSDPFARFKVDDRGQAYVPSAHEPNYSLEIVAEPGLPGVTGVNHFTTNNMGFRGGPLRVPKPSGEYRIFLVGGSTTECMVLDDRVAPDRVLQDRLSAAWPDVQVRVFNAAKSGDKSYDHIAMLSHRIAHLQPDLIVVYAGINDLRAAMLNADYLLMRESTAATYTLSTLLKFAATEFQVPRRLYGVLHNLVGKSERDRLEEVQLLTDYREKSQLKEGRPVSDRAPRTDLVPYKENLATLVGVARAHGSPIVMVTQATSWNSTVDTGAAKWHWLTYVDGVLYREDLMDAALESYNEQMRSLATETGMPLMDLSHVLPKSLEYFYDDAHFNVKGAREFGTRLADFILERELRGPKGTAPLPGPRADGPHD